MVRGWMDEWVSLRLSVDDWSGLSFFLSVFLSLFGASRPMRAHMPASTNRGHDRHFWGITSPMIGLQAVKDPYCGDTFSDDAV